MHDAESARAGPAQSGDSILRGRIRTAILWRSGSQIVAQVIQWTATFVVIRILAPADYGLFAMTGAVLVLLNMLNGYGVASGLVQQEHVSPREIRQAFGLLLLLNGALALAQVALAPLAAAYYRVPEVAALLRVQALLYLTTPFVALPSALLSRAMDYRAQATATLAASLAAALAALAGALAGLGVWTLVLAPLVLFTVRAIGMTWAARSLVWPSFDFRGAGALVRFGSVLAAGQLFWFVQSQADVLIGGRLLGVHDLGLYTTALFLAQIFVSKVVPPLNDVAFSAYARMRDDADASAAFVKAARLIFAAALPFYFGLAAVAVPLVETVLGAKWAETAPLVRLLALAMPFMTMQVLLAPACDARGRPDVGVRNGAGGAVIMGLAFLIGAQWGARGLAAAWLAAYPVYLWISCRRSLPVIGVEARALARAVAPSLAAAAVMALGVVALLPVAAILPRPAGLALLVAAGGLLYALALATASRALVGEILGFVRGGA